MDSKQLVGLWYSGAALALAHVFFGVSGLAVILCVALTLAVVIVQLVLPHRSVRAERPFVAIGVPLFVGQLVLSALLVAQWRTSLGAGVANVDPTSGTLASVPGQASTTGDAAIDETVSVLTDGAKSGSGFTQTLPQQAASPSRELSTATPKSRKARDKGAHEPPPEPCHPLDDGQGEHSHDGRPDGCAPEADQSSGRVSQTIHLGR